VPLAQAAIKAAGGRLLAVGQNITPIEGTPPKPRVSIQQWESIEQYNAYRKSVAFVDARKIGDKYAKFRSFAIEGIPQYLTQPAFTIATGGRLSWWPHERPVS
jgi:uncharacterized protein (DUF1330 family)